MIAVAGPGIRFSAHRSGVSLFVPETRWTFAVSASIGLRLGEMPGWRPFFVFFRLSEATDERPCFAYLRHLRPPYGTIKIGAL